MSKPDDRGTAWTEFLHPAIRAHSAFVLDFFRWLLVKLTVPRGGWGVGFCWVVAWVRWCCGLLERGIKKCASFFWTQPKRLRSSILSFVLWRYWSFVPKSFAPTSLRELNFGKNASFGSGHLWEVVACWKDESMTVRPVFFSSCSMSLDVHLIFELIMDR